LNKANFPKAIEQKPTSTHKDYQVVLVGRIVLMSGELWLLSETLDGAYRQVHNALLATELMTGTAKEAQNLKKQLFDNL